MNCRPVFMMLSPVKHWLVDHSDGDVPITNKGILAQILSLVG